MFDFYNMAIRPRYGVAVTKFALRQEKLDQDLKFFNSCSYICVEDPFVLDHNVGYNFRIRNIFRMNTLFNMVASSITTTNCISLLMKPRVQIHKPRYPLLYPPFNLCQYSLKERHHPMGWTLVVSENPISMNQITDSIRQLQVAVVTHFIDQYLCIRKFNVSSTPNGNLVYKVNIGHLFHLTKIPSFAHLANFVTRRERDLTSLLRYRSARLVETEFVDPGGIRDWFEFRYKKSNSSFYYSLNLMQRRTKNFELITEAILELLLLFMHSIDRGNAVEEFTSLMSTFFSNQQRF